MKCPHCDHKTSLLGFMLTVMNPFRIRCSACAKLYSVGGRATVAILLGIAIGVFIALRIYHFPLGRIVVITCLYAIIMECLIWALAKPVRK